MYVEFGLHTSASVPPHSDSEPDFCHYSGSSFVVFRLFLCASRAATHRTAEEIGQTTTDLQVVKELGLRLERQLQYVRTDAYKETVAREQLGMAREGDKVVAIISDGSLLKESGLLRSTANSVDIGSLPIWQQWLTLFNFETDLGPISTRP